MTRSIKNQITHTEVGDMEKPAQRILREMETKHQRITQGHYRLVVGDDASGRLFGMIFHGVIRNIYAKLQIPPPGLAFCVGHPKRESSFYEEMTSVVCQRLHHILHTNIYSDMDRALQRPIEPKLPDPQILITTDGIQSGSSLIPAIRACKKYEVGIDAAAIKVFFEYREEQRPNLKGVNSYDGRGKRSIYQRYPLIGVHKTLGVDMMARVYESDGDSSSVQSARQDVHSISKRLTDWFVNEFTVETKA